MEKDRALLLNRRSILFGIASTVVVAKGGAIGLISDALAPIASEAPAEWLLCDGSLQNRNIYSGLFHLIGYSYGEGPSKFRTDSEEFRLPDLRAATIIGAKPEDAQTEPTIFVRHFIRALPSNDARYAVGTVIPATLTPASKSVA